MDFDGFFAKCKSLADQLKAQERITVVGHYDADGLASTGIMVKALRRAGVETEFINTRQIDSEHLAEVNKLNTPILFVDMGSGQIELLEAEVKTKFFIIDHHPPVKETDNQVNPFQYDINGTRELSATGACYFVAKAMDEKNMDLSPVGIVGAVGDMQDLHGGLKGANRKIIKDAESLGLLDAHKNLKLFGRQSRPLPKMIEYCSEPLLPGLTGNYIACCRFIEQLGIDLKDPIGGEVRHYVDLSHEERQKLTSALYVLLVDHNAPQLVTDMLIGEVYDFPKETPKTELRDAKEFATVLNACVAPETKIMGINGTIMPIDDMAKFPTFSYLWTQGSIIHNQHEKLHKVRLPDGLHMFEITTKMGLSVSATENHRFFTCSNANVSWKPAEEISPKDYLAIPKKFKTTRSHYYYETTDLFSEDEITKKDGKFRLKRHMNFIINPKITEEFFELAGFILGDGHLSKSGVNLVFGKDKRGSELELRYKNVISDLFGINSYTTSEKPTFKNIIYNNLTLRAVFERIGIPVGNKTKVVDIPQKLLMGPDSFVAATIRGLIESDGNVYSGGLEFSTHSKDLAEQFPLVLLRFGIKSHLMVRKCNDCDGLRYRVLICGYENIQKYSDSVGFVTTERKQWLRTWLNKRKVQKSNTDLVPFANKGLMQLHEGLGILPEWSSHFTYYKRGTLVKRANLAKYLNYFDSRIKVCKQILDKGELSKILDVLGISMTEFSKHAGISREWVAQILNGKAPCKNAKEKIGRGIEYQKARISELEEVLNNLKILTQSDLQWDQVKSVTIPPRPEYVYDLSMSQNHNYFANGILVHNCGRHEAGEVGVEVCMGNRTDAWESARGLLEKHRRELREGLEWVKENGIQEMDNIYYFDASGVIRETLVGIIAGMTYGAMSVKMDKPIIAFGMTDEGEMKISGRGNYNLVRSGLKLGVALGEASRQFGGDGGGHDVAAGAKIPPEKKEEFLKVMDGIVSKQLKK